MDFDCARVTFNDNSRDGWILNFSDQIFVGFTWMALRRLRKTGLNTKKYEFTWLMACPS